MRRRGVCRRGDRVGPGGCPAAGAGREGGGRRRSDRVRARHSGASHAGSGRGARARRRSGRHRWQRGWRASTCRPPRHLRWPPPARRWSSTATAAPGNPTAVSTSSTRWASTTPWRRRRWRAASRTPGWRSSSRGRGTRRWPPWRRRGSRSRAHDLQPGGAAVQPGATALPVHGREQRAAAELLIEVLADLGRRRALVVCGAPGIDDLSIAGPTEVFTLDAGAVRRETVSPEQFGIAPVSYDALPAGSGEDNAALFTEVIAAAAEPSPLTDLICLNAGAGAVLRGGRGQHSSRLCGRPRGVRGWRRGAQGGAVPGARVGRYRSGCLRWEWAGRQHPHVTAASAPKPPPWGAAFGPSRPKD